MPHSVDAIDFNWLSCLVFPPQLVRGRTVREQHGVFASPGGTRSRLYIYIGSRDQTEHLSLLVLLDVVFRTKGRAPQISLMVKGCVLRAVVSRRDTALTELQASTHE